MIAYLGRQLTCRFLYQRKLCNPPDLISPTPLSVSHPIVCLELGRGRAAAPTLPGERCNDAMNCVGMSSPWFLRRQTSLSFPGTLYATGEAFTDAGLLAIYKLCQKATLNLSTDTHRHMYRPKSDSRIVYSMPGLAVHFVVIRPNMSSSAAAVLYYLQL